MLKRALFLFAFTFSIFHTADAAFPIQKEPVQETMVLPEGNGMVMPYHPGSTTYNHDIEKNSSKRQKGDKSQATAIILNLFFGVFGVHRFYLGYTREGFLQLLGYVLIIVGSPLLTFTPIGFTPIAAATVAGVCIAAGIAVFVWEIIDFFRICNESLTPKKGSYR